MPGPIRHKTVKVISSIFKTLMIKTGVYKILKK